MYGLGYVGKLGDLDRYISGAEIDSGSLAALSAKRSELNKEVNQALRESQM